MDYVYPNPPEVPHEYDDLDKEAKAGALINLIENGAPADYKGFSEGDRLDKIHVCAIAAASTNFNPADISLLYDEIEEERKQCLAIHPCEYDTLNSFKSALEKVTNYLNVNIWITRLQEQFGVETWDEMQAWCDANYNQEP